MLGFILDRLGAEKREAPGEQQQQPQRRHRRHRVLADEGTYLLAQQHGVSRVRVHMVGG